ncbi:hypothetical protein AKJ09_06697 [Labilithrix luteola]|uniref:Uncharacterized protein n=1 Tax=Labilithrix luteola TaxID=1391654 RepID=A0A0K1Q2N9_9BACT|nr:hypothetical protein AKJ09_06697 [Labilithrix luteola]
MLLLVACGSRTGLFVDGSGEEDNLPGVDAGRDGNVVPPKDAGRDSHIEPDALPPIDATPPRDANRTDCPDAEATLVYLITSANELYSFDPGSVAMKKIGNIACPANPGATPFSMAVDRKGIAYILFSDRGAGVDDGRLFRVSTANAACISTSFVPNQHGFLRFGMGFAANTVGPTETLYVAGSEQDNGATGLARIDIPSFKLSKVGNFRPDIGNAELTGTGDGRLYGFYADNTSSPAFIGEIDTQTGHIVGQTQMKTVTLGNGWAFAFWGGDFYMFTSPGGGFSTITRYRPSDNTEAVVGSVPTVVVGAGVSTCAPAQ